MNPMERPPGQQESPKLVKCPHCGGNREKNGETCKPCSGTGQVKDR